MAEYEYQFTEQHLVASASRYRQQAAARLWLFIFKLVGIVGAAALLGLCLYSRLVWPSAIFAILIVLLALGPRIDYWVMKRRFRRSPFYNGDVRVWISSSGVVSSDPQCKVELAWSAFTEAHRFPDGFLVLFGPQQFYWWPDSALRDGSVSEVESLLSGHVVRYVGPQMRT